MKLSTFYSGVAALSIASSSLFAAEGWETDFEAAKKKAKEEKKDLLVDFTGSDWCHWCKVLDEEVFQQETFKGSENFILVELDYPRDKSKQSDALKKQNSELKKAYGIKGYPTVYLMDSEGRPYARTGYVEGGAEAYSKMLNELVEIKVKRDEKFATAEAMADGKEKAQTYVDTLNSLDDVSPNFYPTVIEKIKSNDPDQPFLALIKMDELMKKKELTDAEILTVTDFMDSQAKSKGLEGEQLQRSINSKFEFLIKHARVEELAIVLDEMIAVDPESEVGKTAIKFKQEKFTKLKEMLMKRNAAK
ncbi:thioredoxin family protein [Akkermansiaceae bacterium]|nr:thioredoxin family protein [Akkermansiaceae bacterium]